MGQSHCEDDHVVVYLADGKPVRVSDGVKKIIRWLIARHEIQNCDKLRITINISGSSIRYELATFDTSE